MHNPTTSSETGAAVPGTSRIERVVADVHTLLDTHPGDRLLASVPARRELWGKLQFLALLAAGRNVTDDEVQRVFEGRHAGLESLLHTYGCAYVLPAPSTPARRAPRPARPAL